MVETNSGVLLEHMVRTGACGTWWTASTPNGYPLGLLQLERDLIATPVARDRAAAAITAVRAVQAAGVLRTTELFVETKRAWLVVATPPGPTVADLLAASGPLDPGSAARVAADVADALRDLHAAGLRHGDLGPDTVILMANGMATVAEVGVLAALHDTPTDVGADTRAWADLARQLAAIAPPTEGEVLLTAAGTAELGDLTTAARQVATAAAGLPGFSDRELLAIRLKTVTATTAAHIPTQRTPMNLAAATGDAVRIRFGRGLPDSVIAAALAELAQKPRRRSLLAIQLVAAALVVLLGAGAVLALLLVR